MITDKTFEVTLLIDIWPVDKIISFLGNTWEMG